MTPEQKTVDNKNVATTLQNLQELAELRSKVEEFRVYLSEEINKLSIAGNLVSTEYRIGFCEQNEKLATKFSSLFPPPKKGCWGFWRDAGCAEKIEGGRYFCPCYDKEDAEVMRNSYKDQNPSLVFFLPEEK